MRSKVLKLAMRAIHKMQRQTPVDVFPLTPPLPLPEEVSEQQLFEFVTSIGVQDAPEAEMRAYGTQDFRRFVYTWGMASDIKGKCLIISRMIDFHSLTTYSTS